MGDWETEETVLSEVDNYAKTIAHASGSAKIIFVPTWTIPAMHLGNRIAGSCAGKSVFRAG